MATATSFVYGLVDPTTRLVFYVGQSTTGMTRPRRHASKGWVYDVAILEAVPDPRRAVDELCPWLQSPRMPTALHEAERWWIAYGRASGWPLRNATDGGEGTRGAVRSASTRAKISAYQRRRPPDSEVTRQRRRAANRGRKATDATRARISAAKRDPSPETRARIAAATRRQFANPDARVRFSEAQRRRSPASATTRAKIAAASRGRKSSPEAIAKRLAGLRAKWPELRERLIARNKERVVSAETRAKMSAAAKRRSPEDRARGYEKTRNPSPETLAKMSAASRSRSPETIAKIRAATLAQWERKKQRQANSTEPGCMQPDSSNGPASEAPTSADSGEL